LFIVCGLLFVVLIFEIELELDFEIELELDFAI
jgi:hypothetical protein